MTAVLRACAVVLALVASAANVAVAQTRWPSEGPPRPLPAHPVSFPPYEMRTLDNGLRVVAVLHHEQPIISIRMIVRAGAALDPQDKAGLANLAASLLDQGTETMTAQEMSEQVDFIGGAMGAGAGTDLTFANVIVMKDSFETGLRLLSDMSRRPAFAPEEIDRQRQQAISNLWVNLEDPEFIADAVFDRLVYGKHPYGMPQSGTPETLASITRADLVAYHQKYFIPNNAILAIVGDITADEAFDGVRKIFGDWARRELPAATVAAPPDPSRRIVVVNKPDAVQTEVRVGQIGVKRTNSDYMSLNLTLRILGGEGANRLHQVLRTQRGLTYGAKADMDTLLDSGDFKASTNTRSEATGEVLRLMVDEFWKLQRERVDDRELSDAKAYMTGSFPLTIETPDAIATQVLNTLFYGVPVEELQSFRDRVNAVRSDDIERVARYYLHPDRLSIVLVGNAAAFLPQLKGLGFGTPDVIDIREFDLMAANFKRAGRAAGRSGIGRTRANRQGLAYQPQTTQATRRPSTTPAEQENAQALLAQMIAAKGGLDRLRSVTSLTATTTARSLVKGGPVETIQTTTYLEYPNHVRVETRGVSGEIVQGYDGAQAWVKDREGVHDVPGTMLQDLEAGLARDIIALLLAAESGRVHIRLLPDSRDDRGRTQHALEFSSQTMDPTVMYVDPETHLVARQTYVAGGMGGALVEELFDGYQTVDGIAIAHRATVRVGGESVLERRVTRIVVNAPISPSLFARPAS